MPRSNLRHVLPAVLVAALTASASAAARSPIEPSATSVLVRLAGPSVTQHMGQALPALGLAPETRRWAVDHRSAVAAAEAAVARSQAGVVAAIEAAGARVVSRYTTVANALLVHAPATRLASLSRLPGVVAVEPAPRVRPALRHSAPGIGAPQLSRLKGYYGTGTVIAVADTGIDYTHAAFGGPGVPAAYVAAAGRAEVIDDAWEGRPLFPTAKVIGGWDFVGPNYSSPTGCTPALESAGRCTTVPHPDPDPLDQHGHGSHVAGIAAGLGTSDGRLAPGVAPGAALVALKIYGPPQAGVYVDEAVDVVLDVIEWCTRVNLGLPVPGLAPPRVDVVNLSLGEDWGQGSRLFDEAVAAAARAGIVVVAAAGNSGDRPYILNAPGASPQVVAVANVTPPGGVITATARWDRGGTSFQAVEASFTPVLALVGRVDAGLARLGDGCGGAPPVDDPRGRVALVEPGGCGEEAKIVAAEAAGAVAALVVAEDLPRPIAGTAPVGIPAFSVGRNAGDDLLAALATGQPVRVVLDPGRDVSADLINGSSGRGPGRNGALKPDLAAPGTGILSVAMGSGAGGSTLSGTSMATPHVAGAAALLAERARVERLGLRALDVAALLMNHARPILDSAGAGVPLPIARQGAGRIDVLAAGAADLVVRAGDIASAQFGHVAVRRAGRLSVPLTVRNLGPETVRLRPAVRFRAAEDENAGVTPRLGATQLTVPARGTAATWLSLDVDPARLRPWLLRGQQAAPSATLDLLEVDGDVAWVAVDEAGATLTEVAAPRLPFYVLPRAAASAWATGYQAPALAAAGTLTLTNRTVGPGGAAELGRVELFPLPAGGAGADPDDAAGELDVWRVAARFEPAAEPGAVALSVGVVLRRLAVLPQLTRVEVYVSVDGDAVPDWRVRSAAEAEVIQGGQTERLVVTATRWDAANSTPLGAERVVGALVAEMHGRFLRLTVPLSALALDRPVPLAYYVVHRGLGEDWPVPSSSDVVPDGAEGLAGPRYSLDPGRTGGWPDRWTMTLRPDAAVAVSLDAGATTESGLLAVYPDNPLELGEQTQLIPVAGPIGPPPWDVAVVYLPVARR